MSLTLDGGGLTPVGPADPIPTLQLPDGRILRASEKTAPGVLQDYAGSLTKAAMDAGATSSPRAERAMLAAQHMIEWQEQHPELVLHGD